MECNCGFFEGERGECVCNNRWSDDKMTPTNNDKEETFDSYLIYCEKNKYHLPYSKVKQLHDADMQKKDKRISNLIKKYNLLNKKASKEIADLENKQEAVNLLVKEIQAENEKLKKCPNCITQLQINEEIIMGDKFKSYYCKKCKLNFVMISTEYLDTLHK